MAVVRVVAAAATAWGCSAAAVLEEFPAEFRQQADENTAPVRDEAVEAWKCSKEIA